MTDNSAGFHQNDKLYVNFSFYDAIFIISSMSAIVIDHATDVILVIDYYTLGYHAWASTILLMLLIPTYIVQIISFAWHLQQCQHSKAIYVTHIFPFGLINRYLRTMIFGLKLGSTTKGLGDIGFLAEQNDASLLFLFQSFLESAPQLVVQLHIIASLPHLHVFTCVSAATSIASLSLAVASYSRSQQQQRMQTAASGGAGQSCGSSTQHLNTVSRLSLLAARIAALVLLLLVFQSWFLLFIGVHWASMFVWIVYQKTETEVSEPEWQERCFNAIAAFIYCFSFFNLKHGDSRWRLVSYYSLIVFQNVTCLTMFLMFHQAGDDGASRTGIIAFVVILGGTVIGTLNVILFYRFFHPSGPIDMCGDQSDPARQVQIRAIPGPEMRSLKNLRSSGVSASPPSQSASPSNVAVDLKLTLSDSIVIVEESDMDDIRTLHKWIEQASQTDLRKRYGVTSPGVELFETASSELSAHDYENMAAVNIAREGRIRTWRGYCDIDAYVHDGSVGRDGAATTPTTTTTSHDYLDSLVDDYADCKTSSLHTILEESESNCSERSRAGGGSCALVATIDQIRTRTPMPDPERGARVRRTFSLLRERFECSREPPPPAAPWGPHSTVGLQPMRDGPDEVSPPTTPWQCGNVRSGGTPPAAVTKPSEVAAVSPDSPSRFVRPVASSSPARFVSVRDMRDFFLRQLLTPPKFAVRRQKLAASSMA